MLTQKDLEAGQAAAAQVNWLALNALTDEEGAAAAKADEDNSVASPKELAQAYRARPARKTKDK